MMDRVKMIEVLSDGAHNLPQIVAQFGKNGWACAETLLMECGLCEDALKQSGELATDHGRDPMNPGFTFDE